MPMTRSGYRCPASAGRRYAARNPQIRSGTEPSPSVQCPRDNSQLVVEQHRGIDVDRCPQCRGGWLDEDELAKLESTVESTDEQRTGMIEYAQRESELACPKCG